MERKGKGKRKALYNCTKNAKCNKRGGEQHQQQPQEQPKASTVFLPGRDCSCDISNCALHSANPNQQFAAINCCKSAHNRHVCRRTRSRARRRCEAFAWAHLFVAESGESARWSAAAAAAAATAHKCKQFYAVITSRGGTLSSVSKRLKPKQKHCH